MSGPSVVSNQPMIVQMDDILGDDDLKEVVDCITNRHWLAQRDVSVRMDATGTSFELADTIVPALTKAKQRIAESLGIREAKASSIRIRDYRAGNSHGAHGDHYQLDDDHLILTALLYLTSTESGGETCFMANDLSFKPVSNRMIAWLNYRDDGEEDPLTQHESRAVVEGRKIVAIYLFYGDLAETADIRRHLVHLGEGS